VGVPSIYYHRRSDMAYYTSFLPEIATSARRRRMFLTTEKNLGPVYGKIDDYLESVYKFNRQILQ